EGEAPGCARGGGPGPPPPPPAGGAGGGGGGGGRAPPPHPAPPGPPRGGNGRGARADARGDGRRGGEQMPVTQRKPEWRGGTHPLAMLHGNAAWGELLDHQGWLLNHGQSEADAIDRDIDRALARGRLPTGLGRRLEGVQRGV